MRGSPFFCEPLLSSVPRKYPFLLISWGKKTKKHWSGEQLTLKHIRTACILWKKRQKILNKWWQGYVQKGNLVILLGMETGTAITENSIKILQNIKKTTTLQGLPWWYKGWEPTCHCRGHAFDLGSRRILHAVEQLSLSAAAAEVQAPRACALQQEATAMRKQCTVMRTALARHN